MTEIATHPAEYRDSTRLLDDPVALRARAEEDGLLFFRQALPRDEVLKVRHDVLQICQRQGWIKAGTDPDLGLGDLNVINQIPLDDIIGGAGIPRSVYAEIQKLESFHKLAHHPNLIRLYSTLFDKPVFVHPRNISRVILPHKNSAPTPPHQDFIHVQGATNTWTCWFPLGDCPVSLGGLSVLRNSHRQGIRHLEAAPGAGGVESQICANEREWLQADFAAGDLVTFPSLTVHKALPHSFRDRIRVSCDFRYQPADEPIEERSLGVHFGDVTWEEIYAGWKDDRLKYYWKSQTPPLSPWDESVRWQKQRIC